MDAATINRVAEAIWGSPANKRIVAWATMDEKVKDLWRDDAKRAIAAFSNNSPPGEKS